MNIFVTGGTGFVGGAAITRLKRSHKIRAMSRSQVGAKKIEALGATPIICSLDNITAEHLKGIDVVIHSAAYVEEWGFYKDYYQANVKGTRRMLEVAKAAGVKRFIHIGTEAALFRGQDMVDIDESYPYPKSTPFYYSRTKQEAEKLVLAANEPGFSTISLRPRFVWGPGDKSVLPAILDMIRRGQFMWLDNGEAQTSTTYIDNLTQAIELGLKKGRGGAAYFIADKERSTMKEFLTKLIQTEKVEVPEKSISSKIAKPLAFIIESIWRLLRIKSKPPMTRFAINIMSADCTVNTTRAKKELDYRPKFSVERGLHEMRKVS